MIPEPGEEQVMLVVDDDPNALDLLGRTLQEAGVSMVTASAACGRLVNTGRPRSS